MLSKNFESQKIEEKWYQFWIDNDVFSSYPNPDKEPYTVVIPPPNVTGVLHMGHMLNNTIQDILVRKARMEGKEACWVPGTDHASIATEAKVVAMLKEQGIAKKDLTREQFLKYAYEWKDKYGGIILQQLRRLGASCDWKRTRFTMDEKYYEAVIETFVRLYDKGLIYRGIRMVNWDSQGKTAVSDEEVIVKEIHQKLYYIRYGIVGEENFITIATVRPETIMADAAIAVHPSDERYQNLIGKKAIIPLINKEIPIIADEYVSPEFGTGALKITPAHDTNDYQLGVKHKLPVIDILNDDGTLNEKGQILVGEDRFIARKKIGKLLEESGNLAKTEEYTSNIGTSERTGAIIEPRLSLQWFMKMEDLAKPALAAVQSDEIKLYPPKFKNLYNHWMENIKDWCISRQLWWGHQIPAFYLKDGTIIVAKNKREALQKAQRDYQLFALTESDLTQDEDVLDTWASSWLWPFDVFDATISPDNQEVKYFYPTNDLVTAPEILFFWVARMIMAGYECMGEKPFTNVYLTGIVRDKQGRKMSKSLGNSPDPIELIEKYGADGVRTGMLFSSPAGNDLLFDEKLCEQGRNFCNKIWNAFRLVKSWEEDKSLTGGENPNTWAIHWFEAKFNQTLTEILDFFQKFRISEALLAVYQLIWDDFCSKYLELVKPAYQSPCDKETYEKTIAFLEELMRLVHPFMPFISEEIWQNIALRQEKECLAQSYFPIPKAFSKKQIEEGDFCFEIISQVRNLRNSAQISPKISLKLLWNTLSSKSGKGLISAIEKLANVKIEFSQATDGKRFMVKTEEFYLIVPKNEKDSGGKEDLQKELDYLKGFLETIETKLSNERFVQNAKPDILAREQQKRDDTLLKIKSIEGIL